MLELHLNHMASGADAQNEWLVYVLAAADCARFKIGFTCNALQRLCAFNPRYFEYFDLHESWAVRVVDEDAARRLEAALKSRFALLRTQAPPWARPNAGGATEWFQATQLTEAIDALQSSDTRAFPAVIYERVRDELVHRRLEFEVWASAQASQLIELRDYARRGYCVEVRDTLRDWLAYAYFAVPLFADNPEMLQFVMNASARRA